MVFCSFYTYCYFLFVFYYTVFSIIFAIIKKKDIPFYVLSSRSHFLFVVVKLRWNIVLVNTFQHFSKKKKCSLNKKVSGNAETLSPLTLLGAVAIKENVFRFIYMFNIIIHVFIYLIYFCYEKWTLNSIIRGAIWHGQSWLWPLHRFVL